jgi:hypothetical protein
LSSGGYDVLRGVGHELEYTIAKYDEWFFAQLAEQRVKRSGQSHWCTILMSVAVRLLMHPRCRQVTAFLVSDACDVLNEFCGAWRCPGTR